jgi:prepilin peptidase CpaA
VPYLSYLPAAVQALLILLVIPAAFYDLRWRKIPNWLTLSGLVLAIGMNLFFYKWPGLLMSLKGIGLACLIYFPLYFLRAMGAGDVKLMAAVGAAVGPANWFAIFILTCAFGALAALTLIAARGRFRQTVRNIGIILTSLARGRAPFHGNPELDVRTDKGIRLPHAVSIACGTTGFLVGTALWLPK